MNDTLEAQMKAELRDIGTVPNYADGWPIVMRGEIKDAIVSRLAAFVRAREQAARLEALEAAAKICDGLIHNEPKEAGEDAHGTFARLAWTAPRIRALKLAALRASREPR